MKINGYIIEIVCANYDKENKCYGDIYEEVEQCLQEHPNDEVIYGFHLRKDGVETPDQFFTIDEAIYWASND